LTAKVDDYGIRVAALTDGRIVVAWTAYTVDDPSGAGRSIRARVLDADGTPAGPDFLVNTTPVVIQTEINPVIPLIFSLTGVVASPGSAFDVIWVTDEDPQSSFQVHARIRAFDGSGQPLGSDQDRGTSNIVYPKDEPGTTVDQYLTLR